MTEEIKVFQYKKLDDIQKVYQDWRKALHLTEFENRVDFFQGFQRELVELEEELKFERKNRLNIAGEAADILLYAVGMLDQEDTRFSSLLSNGQNVTFFNELQKIISSRLKEKRWESSREIFEKIKKDTQIIDEIIHDSGSDIRPSLKEIVLDSASLITLLGLPIGKIVSGKIARNEKKYPRALYEKEVLTNDYPPGLGQLAQSLPELVRLRHQEMKNRWDKELDAKYLKTALGPTAGLYLFGTAAAHRLRKLRR